MPTPSPIMASPAASQDTADTPFQRAVVVLTQALQTPEPLDFADFLAASLAAVAANVGGVDHLLAGRPGSWEAGLVAQLVEGTVGMDPEELWSHRTLPVIVPLHVAELVECRYGLPGLGAARDRLDEGDQQPAGADLTLDECEAYDADLAALEAAWRAAYAEYGLAFARAVQDRAAQLTRLKVPVTVQVVDDPDATWWRAEDTGSLNPHEDGDPLVVLFWEHAADAVPLPVDEHGRLTGVIDASASGDSR